MEGEKDEQPADIPYSWLLAGPEQKAWLPPFLFLGLYCCLS